MVCECALIEAVRRDDARMVREYAEDRLVRTKVPNMSEDITAALRVAAQRIEDVNVEVER